MGYQLRVETAPLVVWALLQPTFDGRVAGFGGPRNVPVYFGDGLESMSTAFGGSSERSCKKYIQIARGNVWITRNVFACFLPAMQWRLDQRVTFYEERRLRL